MKGGAERYERLRAIFDRARGLASADRGRVLDEGCASDGDLRAEVEELLAAFDGADLPVFADAGIAAVRHDLEGLVQARERELGVPERIGPYRILRRVAEGGMGVVYEAEQDSPRRRVALKVVHPLFVTPARLKRFRQEAELLGRLSHPGIAQIYAAGTFAGGSGEQPFFAMEFVEGVNLATYVETKKLALRERLALLTVVCDAVQHAHEQGVIHRDLKPDNLLVDARGRPKVLDFGVARASEGSTVLTTLVTEEGDLLGTIAYMAPEQLSGLPDAITPRSDVYALGVIAFQLLAGRLPHDLVGLPLAAAIEIVRDKEPDRLGSLRPELRGDVETIVGKALEKEPQRRYASAADLAADIRALLDNRPITARPPSRIYRAVKFTRRNKALVGGSLSTLAAILGGLVASLRFAFESEQNAVLAREGERRAVGGVLQAAQDLLERGELWDAANTYQRVAGTAYGWEKRFLEQALPRMLPQQYGARAADWVDDEHLAVALDEGGVAVLEIGTWRETRRFSLDGHFFTSTFPVPASTRCEWIGLWQHESVVVDLATGRILGQVELPSERRRDMGVRCVVDVDGGVHRLACTMNMKDRRFDYDVPHDELGIAGMERWPASGFPFISPDGRRIAFMDPNRGHLRVFDARSRDLVGELGGLRQSSCPALFFLPDGRELLLFGPDYHLVRVDLASMEIVQRFASIRGSSCSHGDVSPDGTLYAQALEGRPVEIFDLATDQILVSHGMGLSGSTATWEHELLFSPSGTRLLVTAEDVSSCILEIDRGIVEPGVLATDADPRVVTYRGHQTYVYHAAVSPDGALVASMTPPDDLVRVWDAANGETVATLQRAASLAREEDRGELLSFSPDGRRLFFTSRMPGTPSVELVSWDLLDGEVDRRAPERPASEGDQHLLWLDAFLALLEPKGGMRLGHRAHVLADGDALALSMTPNGFEAPRGERWERFGFYVHCALSASPDGERVALAHLRAVEIVDRHDSTQRSARFEGDAYGVAWSPDGRLIAAGGKDGTIRLYDTEVGAQQLRFRAHDDYVYSLVWTPDGSRLISTSGDGTVRVWDARTPKERAADRLAYESRLAPLRELAAEELAARFETAQTAAERGAVVRAALESRRSSASK